MHICIRRAQELARTHAELRQAARRNAELLQHSVEEADDDAADDDVDDEATDTPSGIEISDAHGLGLGVAVVAASKQRAACRRALDLSQSLEGPLSMSCGRLAGALAGAAAQVGQLSAARADHSPAASARLHRDVCHQFTQLGLGPHR